MDLFDILFLRSFSKTAAQTQLNEIKIELDKKANISDVYTKEEVDAKISNMEGYEEIIFDCGQSIF